MSDKSDDCSSSSSSSSSSDGDIAAPNWELLQETLGEGALMALKAHLEESSQPTKVTPMETPTENEIFSKDESNSNDTNDTESKSFLPNNNKTYSKKEYWEERFATENDFEWLVSYSDISSQIKPFLLPANIHINTTTAVNDTTTFDPSTPNILIVGCGNSSFSADLYDDGYTQITNIDYSTNVISKMKDKHILDRPHMKWVVMDMTDMSAFSNQSFDVVIDKAAMDAIMTDEGDVWNPEDKVIDMSRNMCRHIARILKPGGFHLHISFAQPHFRKRYLLGLHKSSSSLSNEDEDVNVNVNVKKVNEEENERLNEMAINNGREYSKEFGWDHRHETIGGEGENDGCFHHFLYIMQKMK